MNTSFWRAAGLVGLVSLAACGGGDAGQDIVFETVVGPNTEAQIRNLPKGLPGDKDNARYLGTPPPADMDPAASSGGGRSGGR